MAMVPWWKRLLYGVSGWVVTMCAVSLLFPVWVLAQSPIKRTDTAADVLSGVFGAFLACLISVFAVSIFGWLLGLPYVLLVRNSKGWRFWIYFVLGSGIGPVLVLSLFFYTFLKGSLNNLPTKPTDYYFGACISVVVSSLTTLICLLLLRRAQVEYSTEALREHRFGVVDRIPGRNPVWGDLVYGSVVGRARLKRDHHKFL